MKNISTILKVTLVLTLFMAVPKDSFAWHTYWCNYRCYCGKPCNCGYSQSTTPIDGGLSLLLAAGVAYGGRRYAKMKKDQRAK